MKRSATEPEELGPQQLQAVELLLSGKSVPAAAEVVGVDRVTVWRWQKEDFAFQAAYNRGRQELQAAHQARLEALAERALETVESAVKGGNSRIALTAALAVLKGLGFLSGERPKVGETTVRALERQARRDERTEVLLDSLA